MFTQLIKFEWSYHTRQVYFVLGILVFFLLGLQFGSNFGSGAKVHINAPVQVNFIACLLSMSSIFVMMVTCASAMLRDADYKMSELVYATSITKSQLLMSRFIGALGAAFIVMFFAMAGAFAGALLPWIDSPRLGPIVPFNYLWSLLVFILPSMFFSGAVIFSIAALTRNMMATYLGAIALYVLYIVGAALSGSPMFAGSVPSSPEALALAAMFDPFAITTYYEQIQFWTPAQKNQQMVGFEGYLLINRLLFSGLAVMVLAGLVRVFKLQLPKVKEPKDKSLNPLAEKSYRYNVLSPLSGFIAQRVAWVSSLKLELTLILKSKPFMAMIALWCVVILVEFTSIIHHSEFGSLSYASTNLLLSAFQWDVLPRFGSIFIVYYSAEIFWRERNVNISAFSDAMPVASPVLFLAKLLALLMVPITMIAAAIIVAIGFQIANGNTVIEPILYLSSFYYGGLPLVCVAVLALLMQTISPNKYVGMVLTAVIITSTSGLVASTMGLHHPMFHFGSTPEVIYTAMNGYRESQQAFAWYMLYWGALSAVFAIISFVLWPRGAELGLRHRLGQLKLVKPKMKIALLCCLGLFIGSGGYIFYHSNVVNEYSTVGEDRQWRAEYEKVFKQYQHLPKPTITGIKTDVKLFPETRNYGISGEYVLTNKALYPIGRILVADNRGHTKTTVSLKTAKSTEHDPYFGTTWFNLSEPLLPGQTLNMAFTIKAQQSSFAPSSFAAKMVDNGTLIMVNTVMPTLGYRPGRELRSKKHRAAYQLGAQDEPETLEAGLARTQGDFSADYQWIDYETIISTAIDQTAVSQGRLIRQWQAKGRNFFHYKTMHPIRHNITVHSGRYQQQKVQHNGVAITVYHHPEHHKNVGRMIEATKDSLDYFSANFAPYPEDHLRIIEVPTGRSSRQTGFATAGNMLLTNFGGFTTDLENDFELDQVYRRVAHEVAHQWWGYQVDPANVPGSMVFVESLAKYSELRILQGRYGKAHVNTLVDYESQRYLRGRGTERVQEEPLYKVRGDQNYLTYSKGSYVMNALHHSLGETPMNDVMTKLIANYAHPAAPPTTLDFLKLLYAAAPVSKHPLIDELMKQIIIYDFAVESAKYTKLDDGRYQVDVKVTGQRFEVSGAGEESPVDMNAPIEIGVYSDYSFDNDNDKYLLTLQSPVMQNGEAEYRYIVDKKPEYVVIDPSYYRVDKNRQNNLKKIEGL